MPIAIKREKEDLRAADFDAEEYMRTYPDVAAVGMEPFHHYQLYGKSLGRVAQAKPKQLRRIVLLVIDVSTIGGIPSRTRRVLENAGGRSVEIIALTLKNERKKAVPGAICYADDPILVQEMLRTWTPADTVFVISNNAVKPFPVSLRNRIMDFPIVYISAGQMAFFVQESNILLDLDYVDSFRAMKIIAFSDGDINFQRQLGIHGQIKGFVPIELRTVNAYQAEKNTRIAYVGRIDFHAKDCARLIDVARSLHGTRYAPIQIYTTDGSNSPDYTKFIQLIHEAGLAGDFEIFLNCEDKERMFGRLALLLLPSKKESFGNVILEAFSFGVPVIAASYAPGPAEIIKDGETGFLLDEFTGEAVHTRLMTLDQNRHMAMSQAAFEQHKCYSVDAHLDMVEHTARDALQAFRGENVLQVLPRLRITEKIKN